MFFIYCLSSFCFISWKFQRKWRVTYYGTDLTRYLSYVIRNEFHPQNLNKDCEKFGPLSKWCMKGKVYKVLILNVKLSFIVISTCFLSTKSHSLKCILIRIYLMLSHFYNACSFHHVKEACNIILSNAVKRKCLKMLD